MPRSCVRCVLGVLLAAASLVAAPSGAQRVVGTVVERSSGRPVEDAVVTLIDSATQGVGLARSDRSGRFDLRTPTPGYYAVHVRKLGFVSSVSTWIAVDASDTISYQVVLEQAPRMLDPVTVKAERDQLRDWKVFGMDARALIGDFITPSELRKASEGARTYLDLVARTPFHAWVRPDTACAKSLRSNGCLEVFLDDMRLAGPEDLQQQVAALRAIDPAEIHHIVMLRASEAGVLFGTGSYNGVLLLYSKNRAATDSLLRVRQLKR